MELTPEQILIVGWIASGLAMGLRFLAAWKGIVLGKGPMTVIVAAISLILSVIFAPPEFPTFIDPFQYAAAWLVIFSGWVGAGTIIYNLILDRLVERLSRRKLTVEQLAKGNPDGAPR